MGQLTAIVNVRFYVAGRSTARSKGYGHWYHHAVFTAHACMCACGAAAGCAHNCVGLQRWQVPRSWWKHDTARVAAANHLPCHACQCHTACCSQDPAGPTGLLQVHGTADEPLVLLLLGCRCIAAYELRVSTIEAAFGFTDENGNAMKTDLLAYDGQVPGPTVYVRQGVQVWPGRTLIRRLCCAGCCGLLLLAAMVCRRRRCCCRLCLVLCFGAAMDRCCCCSLPTDAARC
jgi:hypothetical protein